MKCTLSSKMGLVICQPNKDQYRQTRRVTESLHHLTYTVQCSIATDGLQLGLCTNTRFIIIPVNRHRYQNRYDHSYSFDIHFDMFLTRYIWKMQEIYVFCSELCWKRLCWHVNCDLPLFCAGARFSQRTRIQEISWGSHSRRHFLNKTMFLL